MWVCVGVSVSVGVRVRVGVGVGVGVGVDVDVLGLLPGSMEVYRERRYGGGCKSINSICLQFFKLALFSLSTHITHKERGYSTKATICLLPRLPLRHSTRTTFVYPYTKLHYTRSTGPLHTRKGSSGSPASRAGDCACADLGRGGGVELLGDTVC